MVVQRIQPPPGSTLDGSLMISRKRQRSAEHDNDDDNNNNNNAVHPPLQQRQNAKTPSQIRKAATTIVATVLVLGLSPAVVAAEENLLHPGVDPLDVATATFNSNGNAKVASAAKLSCHDDPDFISSMGLSCREHEQHGCKQTGITQLGYDLPGMIELLQRCPKTCQVPPCEDHSQDLIREQMDAERHGRRHQQKRDIAAASAQRSLLTDSDDGGFEHQYIIEGQSTTSGLRGNNPGNRNYPKMAYKSGVFESCFEGWHPFCQDDPYYVSKTGLPCEFHSSFDCGAWTNVGYTELEVYDLVNSCPCACAVPCG
jgi:hypothetical protein